MARKGLSREGVVGMIQAERAVRLRLELAYAELEEGEARPKGECDLEQEQFETHITSGEYLIVRSSEVRRLRDNAKRLGIDTSKFDSAVEEAKHRVIVITPADHPPDP